MILLDMGFYETTTLETKITGTTFFMRRLSSSNNVPRSLNAIVNENNDELILVLII